jgi:capsular polysaccharide biosynthesis protein
MDARPPFTLRDALVHRYRVVLVVVGVFLLVAAVLSVFLPRTYESTAVIYLDTARTATDFDAGIAAGDLLQHDFIVSANGRTVLLKACAATGVSCSSAELADPEGTVGKRITATVFRGTSDIAVTAQAPTPAAAAALANAVAQAMIDQDAAEVVRLLKLALDDLDKQMAGILAATHVEQEALKASPPGSPAAAAHEAELARLHDQYTLTAARQLDIQQRQDRLTNVATIINAAQPPSKPEAPSPSRYLLAALVAGLCVGVFAALLIERFDDRISSARSLAVATGVPMAFVSPSESHRLPLPAPPPPKGRLYTSVLSHLLARSPDARAVLVVAASDRDDAEAVASGMSSVARDAGQRVGVVNSNGHWLEAARQPARAASAQAAPTLYGNGSRTASAVADRIPQYEGGEAPADELVLVAVPSPDTSPAALTLGRNVKRAVVVATRGVTHFSDAHRTAELLRESGIEVLAGVLAPRD